MLKGDPIPPERVTAATILFRVYRATGFIPPDLLSRPARVVESFLRMAEEAAACQSTT